MIKFQITLSSLQYNMWLWLAFLVLWQTFDNKFFIFFFFYIFYYSVLVFPPVNNYRRFLIHKVCETVSNDKQNSITTFSIGQNLRRRTVVCQRHQLLIDPKSVALKRWLNWINGFSWLCSWKELGNYLRKHLPRVFNFWHNFNFLSNRRNTKQTINKKPHNFVQCFC